MRCISSGEGRSAGKNIAGTDHKHHHIYSSGTDSIETVPAILHYQIYIERLPYYLRQQINSFINGSISYRKSKFYPHNLGIYYSHSITSAAARKAAHFFTMQANRRFFDGIWSSFGPHA